MRILQRYRPWLLVSFVIGCVAPFQMPLPNGNGRIDFGLQESFCVLNLQSSSPGASAHLQMSPGYDLSNLSDPSGFTVLRLFTAGHHLPPRITIFVDDEPVLSSRVRYSTSLSVERDFCWEEDPVTGKEVHKMCDVTTWEQDKTQGALWLNRSDARDLAAALPDDGEPHVVSLHKKGSHIYRFEFPTEAIAFVGDPRRTCEVLRAKARPQEGS